jgi:hypothetical protein
MFLCLKKNNQITTPIENQPTQWHIGYCPLRTEEQRLGLIGASKASSISAYALDTTSLHVLALATSRA